VQPARRTNEERREHSIQQVLSAALQLFVSKGYENATIDTIAAAAGLTKGAVYFYFKGKAALLHALLDDAEQLYADIFAELRSSGVGPAEQLEMFVDWCAETGAENQELLVLPILVSLQAMGKEADIAAHLKRMYDRYHDEMARITREGQSRGLFDNTVAVKERAAVLVALTDGMLLEWYRFSHTLDGRALAESAKAQILSGLRVSAQ
jgi:AcrR family transcriptional regulator